MKIDPRVGEQARHEQESSPPIMLGSRGMENFTVNDI